MQFIQELEYYYMSVVNRFQHIITIVKTYLLVLSVFFVFTLILFFTEINRINLDEDSWGDIIMAFIMSIRFDIVISGYILLLPALVLSVTNALKIDKPWLNQVIFYWVFIFFTISFAICAADIPYFNQFFSRFSIGAFEWMDHPDFVVGMILQEPIYYLILIPFLVMNFLFYKILRKIIFRKKEWPKKTNILLQALVSLVFLGIIMVGIRGRLEKKSPIRIGTAYFGHNPFLNQLGLNPVFTLMRSYLDTKDKSNNSIHLMDKNEAFKNVQAYLNIEYPLSFSPIARKISPDSINANPPNVILIVMEGMSAAKMSRHGNTKNLTPFLDSLSTQSLYFENIYTAGKHTFNGIFGALFSFPAIYRQHPLKKIIKYNGLGTNLHNNGYSTIYFTTHDGQFDNVQGFLTANDFDQVVSQSDYPADHIKTTLGVPDDYMFEFSMPFMDKLHKNGKPFFAAFMTASDHGPYYIPEYFKPRNTEIKDQIVEYADWSLRQLIQLASKKEWYKNTIFVFIADHGAPLTADYDISLDYFHSPLIYFAPYLLNQPEAFDCIGGQIDLAPTLMGILQLPYVNNSLGIDLLRSQRPYIFINDDDKFGVLDQEYLFIHNDKKEPELFHYPNHDRTNYISSFPEKAQQMEIYAKSNLQVFQEMVLNNQMQVKLENQK